MKRPDLGEVMAVVFDQEHRVRPEVRPMIVRTFRCQRRQHLQALITRTSAGLWLAWRPVDWWAQTARDVWQCEWLTDAPDMIEVTCHCGTARRVEINPYRSMR